MSTSPALTDSSLRVGARGRCRVAIACVTPIFHNHAGNAEYLAAFSTALRKAGCHVELFMLHPESGGLLLRRLYPQYLACVDDIHLRWHFKFGSHFLNYNPLYWLRAIFRLFGFSGRLAQTGERLWGFPTPSARALAWIQKRLAIFAPDLIVANYFNASAVFARASSKARKAILVHDILALRLQSFQSTGDRPDFDPHMVAQEAGAFELADLCVAITDDECRHIATHHPGTRAVVFPFVSTSYDESHPPAAEPICIFVGSDNIPNRHGLQWLLKEVWPLVQAKNPYIRLRIVGGIPVDSMSALPDNVDYVGHVDDVHIEYASANIALVPLRVGSGLKVKLIEALAHGVPVVSTTCGSSGLASMSADCLRIQDDAQGFASAVVEMLRHPDPHELRLAAATLVRQNFSEMAAIGRIRHILNDILGLGAPCVQDA